MVSRTMFSAVPLLHISAVFLVIVPETETGTRLRNGRSILSWGKDAYKPKCIPYGTSDSYCGHIIGNLYVNVSEAERKINEHKMRIYQLLKEYVLQTPGKCNAGKNISFVAPRRKCLEQIDDIYCHHYFKRCFIDSRRPQMVCREACEELLFQICDREFKEASDFNQGRNSRKSYFGYYWDIIDCTRLPFRNESNNCYYPNKVRDELNILKSEDCFYGNGRGYRGDVSTTKKGYTCQAWDLQWPHKHTIDGSIYEEVRNSSNFCRNPGGLGLKGTWCYTTNMSLRWDYCDVPKCSSKTPSSPPADFRGHNLSSTRIKVFWGDVPKRSIHGILIGFHVACEKLDFTDEHFVDTKSEHHKCEFTGMEKYTNYSCRLRAYNNFGNGTWSKQLVISTDEDVPDRPPEEILAKSLGEDAVQLEWNPVLPKYANGEVLGYKIIYGVVNSILRANSIVRAPEHRLKIGGLKPNTIYSFQILAFTSKGNGATSTSFFAKTSPEPKQNRSNDLGKGAIVAASVVPGIVVFSTIFLAIYFARKRRLIALNNGNINRNLTGGVVPYATSPLDWIDRIIANRHGYEVIDDENVPITPSHHRYINIAPDGSLNIPPYLRDIVIEFEQMYENMRYNRLQRRRRTCGKTTGIDGQHPKYDRLDRGLPYYNALHHQNICSLEVPQEITIPETLREHNHYSVDFSELREFMRASESDVCSEETIEIGVKEQATSFHRRRFSIDLGEVREFIAFREMQMALENEYTA